MPTAHRLGRRSESLFWVPEHTVTVRKLSPNWTRTLAHAKLPCICRCTVDQPHIESIRPAPALHSPACAITRDGLARAQAIEEASSTLLLPSFSVTAAGDFAGDLEALAGCGAASEERFSPTTASGFFAASSIAGVSGDTGEAPSTATGAASVACSDDALASPFILLAGEAVSISSFSSAGVTGLQLGESRAISTMLRARAEEGVGGSSAVVAAVFDTCASTRAAGWRRVIVCGGGGNLAMRRAQESARARGVRAFGGAAGEGRCARASCLGAAGSPADGVGSTVAIDVSAAGGSAACGSEW